MRLISQDVLKEYQQEIKEEFGELRKDMKESNKALLSDMTSLLLTSKEQTDSQLKSIKSHFDDQIKMLVLERKNDIKTVESAREHCKLGHENKMQALKSEIDTLNLHLKSKINQVESKAITRPQVITYISIAGGGLIGILTIIEHGLKIFK
jgi:hypothetical protein